MTQLRWRVGPFATDVVATSEVQKHFRGRIFAFAVGISFPALSIPVRQLRECSSRAEAEALFVASASSEQVSSGDVQGDLDGEAPARHGDA